MDHKYIWAIAHSYDWEEGFRTFLTEQAMLDAIREDFDIPADIPDPSRDNPRDSAEFWAEAVQGYEEAKWKAYIAVRIDLETGKHETIW